MKEPDYGGGRRHDEALLEQIEHEWGYDANNDGRECRKCGLPIRWSGRTWLHSTPKPSLFGGITTAISLYEFTRRTGDHRAEL